MHLIHSLAHAGHYNCNCNCHCNCNYHYYFHRGANADRGHHPLNKPWRAGLLALLILGVALAWPWPTPARENNESSFSYPNNNTPEQALLRIEKIGPEPSDAGRYRYRLRVTNLTQEDVGNGLEQIVRGILLAEPLPPQVLLKSGEITVDRGTTERIITPLAPCKPNLHLATLPGFPPSKNELTANMQATLQGWLDDIPANYRLNLLGYSDPRGMASYNRALSKQRAEQVADFFLAQGWRSGQLHVAGLGPEDLITRVPEGLALNRRVELYPGQYPRLQWRIEQIMPGETAELSMPLTRGAFYHDHEIDDLLATGGCYHAEVNHAKTSPTLPKLALDFQLRQSTPKGVSSPPSDRLGQCDPLAIELRVANTGQRSARDLKLQASFPQALADLIEIEGGAPDQSARIMRWTSTRLDRHAESSHRIELAPVFPNLNAQTTARQDIAIEAQAVPKTSIRANLPLSFSRPELSLGNVELPPAVYPGEWFEMAIQVTNQGDWPIHELKLHAELPGKIELADHENNPGQVDWSPGPLPPGERAEQTLRLRIMANQGQIAQHPIELKAFDLAYGEFEGNRCVTEQKTVTIDVQPLKRPDLRLEHNEEVLALGDPVEFSAILVNPNPITQTYTVGGYLKRELWQEPDTLNMQIQLGQQTLQAKLAYTDDSQFILQTPDQAQALTVTVPPAQPVKFSIQLVAAALSEEALRVSSESMVSRFEVAELRLHVSAEHGLASREASDSVLIYR